MEAYAWLRINFPLLKRSGHVLIDTCMTEGAHLASLSSFLPQSMRAEPHNPSDLLNHCIYVHWNTSWSLLIYSPVLCSYTYSRCGITRRCLPILSMYINVLDMYKTVHIAPFCSTFKLGIQYTFNMNYEIVHLTLSWSRKMDCRAHFHYWQEVHHTWCTD
jgi:hypothetical protein